MKINQFLYGLGIALLLITITSCDDEGFHTDYNSHNRYGIDTEQTADRYDDLIENQFVKVEETPISTFSIDADGASYSNVRRFIQQDQQLPPSGAIRSEEMINYFDLDYPYTDPTHPINLNGEVSRCPWNEDHQLIRIGIKGKPMDADNIPSNFVFLLDVSGSMSSDDKLALLKTGFQTFVDELNAYDQVAIVTYAGRSQVVLESTPGDEKTKIKDAIKGLGAGGSTAGAEGIITAYDIAQANFIKGGNNRVIIGTDGDFNVGVSSRDELIKLIEEQRALDIFITVLGVGRGNLNDSALEQIANNGNGNYEYIDKEEQLHKVFIYEKEKFFSVAKDVKVQVEFNPAQVESYRLIGYENRILQTEDFEDDQKDAGEIGANQSITALYEIIPQASAAERSVPTFKIDFRYKEINSDISTPLELEIYDENNLFVEASNQMQFAASVAAYGMLIRESEFKGNSSYGKVLSWLERLDLNDEHGFKAEFKEIVASTKQL